MKTWSTRVTPLFKSGDADESSNYRPISVLPVLSKVVERHIHDSLYQYLSESNLIYKHQSGFRKKHSTETALIHIIDELLFNLDDDRVNGLILVDYRKAFDMVDHTILMEKLKAYGVVGNSLSWFHSYLQDRHQLVTVAGTESDYALIKHGVPQGSILGPLLFIIFINDLPLHVTSSQVDLYADDTTLSSSADVKNIQKLQDTLNNSVKQVNDWATSNKLPINQEKTKALIVTGKRLASKLDTSPIVHINGNPVSTVDNARLLGLEIDTKLSFSPHIEYVCKKLSQRIGVLKIKTPMAK